MIPKEYTVLNILPAKDSELHDLAVTFTLPQVDKERIIRILSYYDSSRNNASLYDNLPFEIIGQIAVELGCKELNIFCKLSNKFNEFCESGQLETSLRQRLQSGTRKDLSNYNKEELQKLCLLGKSKHVITSVESAYILTPEGKVYGFGIGEVGQLGLRNTYSAKIPTLIPGLDDIIQISSHGVFCLALNNNGEVYSFGSNMDGELGLGDLEERYIPTVVPNLKNIIQVSTGFSHSLVLNNKGQVYSFGDNFSGKLGLTGNYDTIETEEGNILVVIPTLIKGFNNIVKVIAGFDFSFLINDIGQVYAFGDNNYGQLGLGDKVDRDIPTLIPNLFDIVDIATSLGGTLALDNKGNVYAFGTGSFGQLGLGHNITNIDVPTLIPNLSNIIAISAGFRTSLVLDDKGKAYIFGSISDNDDDIYFVPYLIENLDNIIEISTNGGHQLFLNKDGEVFISGMFLKDNGLIYTNYGRSPVNLDFNIFQK